MATTIVTKKGSGAPAASDLVEGELAVDTTNGRLYTENSSAAVVELGSNPSGNITFGDNGKAIFGAGSDLEIYHTSTGSHSIIEEVGGGNLVVRTNGPHIEFDKGSTEYMARMLVDGAVELYYDSALKLATTATGIDVTGTVTADGLTVDGTGSVTQSSNAATALMAFTNSNAGASARSSISFASDTGASAVGTVSSGWTVDALNANETFVYGSNGVSLFTPASQDVRILAGGSEKLRVKSDGSVGIGTGSPVSLVDIRSTSPKLTLSNSQSKSWSGAETLGEIAFHTRDGSGIGPYDASFIRSVNDTSSSVNPSGALVFGVSASNAAASEAMRIDSAGAVKINGGVLELGSEGVVSGNIHSQESLYINSDSNGTPEPAPIVFGRGRTGSSGGTEDMRLDGSGNLLVGKSVTTFGTAGIALRGTVADFTRDGGTPINVNRLTSDGSLIDFHKAGTVVGTIGVASGDNFYIGATAANHTGLQFADNVIVPMVALSNSDATTDLGASTVRFKDLYTMTVQASTGTASAPAYSFAADTNSGMYLNSGDTLCFSTAGAERIRIDSSGNLLVGTTDSGSAADRIQCSVTSGAKNGFTAVATTTAGGLSLVNRNSSGTYVGGVSFSNTATSFPTSSDQRLKENIVNAPSASDDIDAIQVRSFDWKADGSHQKYGMVAQELQSVAPEAVSAPEDPDEMMGVDYSKLVPMLVKEIQSLRARVAALES